MAHNIKIDTLLGGQVIGSVNNGNGNNMSPGVSSTVNVTVGGTATQSTIVVGGQKYTVTGSNVHIKDGKITVDGQEIVSIQGMPNPVVIQWDGPAANIHSDLSIVCGSVQGNVRAHNVQCNNVTGNVSAGVNVVCHDVAGDVSAGVNVCRQ